MTDYGAPLPPITTAVLPGLSQVPIFWRSARCDTDTQLYRMEGRVDAPVTGIGRNALVNLFDFDGSTLPKSE
jgi:hypothetical protein